jgi:hypothetical protein
MLGMTLLATIAFAQEASLYDGKWTATYKAQDGTSHNAELVLKGTAGTWKWVFNKVARAGRAVCVNREFPVTVQNSSPSELTFNIEASKTIQGCTDRTVTVKLVDDKNLDGKFSDGTAVTLTRH